MPYYKNPLFSSWRKDKCFNKKKTKVANNEGVIDSRVTSIACIMYNEEISQKNFPVSSFFN